MIASPTDILKNWQQRSEPLLPAYPVSRSPFPFKKNNLALPVPMSEWFIDALTASGIELLTLTPGIAERAVKLSEVHRDPFDRIIMATALEHEAKLLSLDGKFRHYPEVKQFLL